MTDSQQPSEQFGQEDVRLSEQLAQQLAIAAKHANDMSVDEKYQLITRNLQEVYARH